MTTKEQAGSRDVNSSAAFLFNLISVLSGRFLPTPGKCIVTEILVLGSWAELETPPYMMPPCLAKTLTLVPLIPAPNRGSELNTLSLIRNSTPVVNVVLSKDSCWQKMRVRKVKLQSRTC